MKKSLRSLSIIALVLFSGLLFLNSTSATTDVSYISGNSTWTSKDSPYVLFANIIIRSGDILNIQPGTTVHLNGFQIQVYGLLNAQGSSGSKISFASDDNSNSRIVFSTNSSSGSVLDYAILYSVPLVVESGTPKISNCYFTSAPSALITVNGGFPLITNNTISSNSQNCIVINHGQASIIANTISQGFYGIYNLAGPTSIISNNITNCFTGIYTSGQSTIEQNNILHNTNDAISTENVNQDINYNALAFNTCGISGNANINNNTITTNQYGLYGQTTISTIKNNNILDNVENVHLTENDSNVDATHNWWGTTNESDIAKTISDWRVHKNLGNLTYSPFLMQSAFAPNVPYSVLVPTPPPTYPPEQVQTPTPTQTTIPEVTLTATPYPYPTYWSTPTSTPFYNVTILPTDEPQYGGISLIDITNVVVILVAIFLALSIIGIINRRFARIEKPAPKSNPPKRKSRKQKGA